MNALPMTALALLLLGPTAQAQVIAIQAGHVVDVEAGLVLDRQSVIVRDGVIESVGPARAAPPGARVVDLGDYTLMPGFIDAHTHLTIDEKAKDPLSELEHTAAERAFASLPNAKNVLLAGFTTVRDLGPYRALVDVALRDAINRGDVVGPRMYVVGAFVTITGGAGAVTGFAPDVTWDVVRELWREQTGERTEVVE